MKPATRILAILFLTAGLSPLVTADDTDIYLDPLAPLGGEPLVMFTLDYRANMNAVQCSNFAPVATNGTDGIVETCGFSEAFANTLIADGAHLEASDPTKITLYEVIRSVIALVMEDLQDLKVGLMMPHENTTAGGGCDPGETGCSNGAMVMMGFSSLEANDANGNKARFRNILKDIPSTAISNLPDYHPYQLKEMYFEFYRYLTGQDVVFGHQGWQDFDDSQGASSLNLDQEEAMHIDHQIERGPGGTAFTAVSKGLSFQGGSTTTTLLLANNEINQDDIHNDKVIRITSGDSAGEERAITDYTGNTRTATVSPALPFAPLLGDTYEIVQRNYPMWDASVDDGTTYISPLAGGDCTKIFMINIGFGTTNGDNDLDSSIQSPRPAGMGITLSGSNNVTQVIEFMKDIDLGTAEFPAVGDLEDVQNVISYFIMQSANNTQHQWARAGGGRTTALELGTDPDALILELQNIFKSILSVSTTFVAPSVPVNVFNRAQTLNEVFLALFEAEENGLPFWNGNLKKVAIGPDPATGILEIQDVNGDQAIDVDGRLRRDALTFWTDGSALPPPVDDEVANRDGRAIARGGAGQQIPGILPTTHPGLSNATAGARTLFTENPGDAFADSVSDDKLMPLDVSDAVATELWQPLAVESGISAASTFNDATTVEQDHAKNVLRFARGITDEPATGPDPVTPRSWLMGDPLHSRPRPINYGERTTSFSVENPDIRIVIGTNDGYMRMIQNTEPGITAPFTQSGKENWAYMPRAAIPTLERYHENTATDPKHPNTTDGSPVVLIKDADFDGNIKTTTAGDQVLMFFGMRRGGRNLYALDVTDPDNPKFHWDGPIIGGSGDFAELGQTWSQPQLGRIRLNATTCAALPGGPSGTDCDRDVLVFGGGYDGDFAGNGTYEACDTDSDGQIDGDETACFDALGKDLANRITRQNKKTSPTVSAEVVPGTNDDVGNAVFVVDAQTGALIWKAVKDDSVLTPTFDATNKKLMVPDLHDSIPAEITAVDTTGNGFLDRIYAGDTAGRVWRIDLADLDDVDSDPATPEVLVIDDPSLWTIFQIFDVGRHVTPNDPVHDRRFFNRIDVSQTRDDSGPFDSVAIGSGDREDPLNTTTENWFYVVKDRATTSGIPPTTTLTDADLADLSDNCLQTSTLADCGIDSLEFANGWKIRLEASDGEKNLAASVTAGGNVFFTTFAPDPPLSCGLGEGTGRFYALSLADATAIINFDSSNDSTGTTYERFDTLGSGGIPVEVVPLGGGNILVQGQEVGENITATGGAVGFRTYWYELPTL